MHRRIVKNNMRGRISTTWGRMRKWGVVRHQQRRRGWGGQRLVKSGLLKRGGNFRARLCKCQKNQNKKGFHLVTETRSIAGPT